MMKRLNPFSCNKDYIRQPALMIFHGESLVVTLSHQYIRAGILSLVFRFIASLFAYINSIRGI